MKAKFPPCSLLGVRSDSNVHSSLVQRLSLCGGTRKGVRGATGLGRRTSRVAMAGGMAVANVRVRHSVVLAFHQYSSRRAEGHALLYWLLHLTFAKRCAIILHCEVGIPQTVCVDSALRVDPTCRKQGFTCGVDMVCGLVWLSCAFHQAYALWLSVKGTRGIVTRLCLSINPGVAGAGAGARQRS